MSYSIPATQRAAQSANLTFCISIFGEKPNFKNSEELVIENFLFKDRNFFKKWSEIFFIFVVKSIYE